MGYIELYEKCTFNRGYNHNSRDGNNRHSKNDNNDNDNNSHKDKNGVNNNDNNSHKDKNDVNNNGFEISIREIVTTIKITINDVS